MQWSNTIDAMAMSLSGLEVKVIFSAFALVYSICMGFATAFAIWYPPFKYVYSAPESSMVTGSVEWQTSSQAS